MERCRIFSSWFLMFSLWLTYVCCIHAADKVSDYLTEPIRDRNFSGNGMAANPETRTLEDTIAPIRVQFTKDGSLRIPGREGETLECRWKNGGWEYSGHDPEATVFIKARWIGALLVLECFATDQNNAVIKGSHGRSFLAEERP